MSSLEAINLLAAFVVCGPFASVATQLVKRSHWETRSRFAVAVMLSIAVGLAEVWLTGDVLGLAGTWGHLTTTNVAATAGCVFASSSAFYKLYFGDTRLAARLERV